MWSESLLDSGIELENGMSFVNQHAHGGKPGSLVIRVPLLGRGSLACYYA
jgi:hypothetical protein